MFTVHFPLGIHFKHNFSYKFLWRFLRTPTLAFEVEIEINEISAVRNREVTCHLSSRVIQFNFHFFCSLVLFFQFYFRVSHAWNSRREVEAFDYHSQPSLEYFSSNFNEFMHFVWSWKWKKVKRVVISLRLLHTKILKKSSFIFLLKYHESGGGRESLYNPFCFFYYHCNFTIVFSVFIHYRCGGWV